jgi:nucleotide-binding universal stress UspA family protein
MFQRILIPLDSSSLAELALAPAYRLAQTARGEILLVHVLPPDFGLAPGEMTGYGVLRLEMTGERGRQAAQSYLENVQAAKPAGVTVRNIIAEGDPAETIVDTAATERADLIAMSSHGYSGLMRWMLGSVTERVLQDAPCPVLVSRGDGPIRKILIPLDGSELSERAIAPGHECARRLGADVVLLHAVERADGATGGQAATFAVQPGGDKLSASSTRVEDFLREAAAGIAASGVSVQTEIITGAPASCIVDFAAQNHVDLIVMSTHGRKGLQRWRYGSVTEKVLHSAPCSLMIVRPSG